MEQTIKNKILLFDELIKEVEKLKQSGKTVIQSHGVFDLIHPGLIKHLNEARKQGDILVVTIIKDKDVRRGPGRPVFSENLRAENVASLEQVDYVSVVDDEMPFECVKRIKPDVFAKGQKYKERDQKIHKKIFEDEKDLYFKNINIHETDGFSFSSSQIIKSFLDIYPEETKAFLKRIHEKYSFNHIVEELNNLNNLKVLLIGDGIIDEYHYCAAMGRAAKAHLIVNKYLTHEVFAGGAFAIANHLAGLCDNVQLVTLLGNEDSREDYISNNLKPNIKTKFFYRKDGPTIVKKRYINQYMNQKLFEINYINDSFINEECEESIINYLKSEIPDYDVVLISDFGHGLITNKINKTIEKHSKQFSVNAQTNGANAGFNLITRYQNPRYVCLDEPEARLSMQEKFSDIESVTRQLSKTIKSEHLIITLGKKGSIGINGKSEVNRTPIFLQE